MPKSLMGLKTSMDSSTWDQADVHKVLSGLGDHQVGWFTFMLDGCHCSSVALTPAKYEQSGRSPKVVALFSARNISSNIVWLLQLHDTIQTKSILVPNLVAFISQNEKNVWFFDYHLLTCSVRKMVLICLMQNIDMCLLHKSYQIARLVSHLINHFSKWMFTV